MIIDGGPAFPTEQHECQDNTWNQTYEQGMSLRDWFAGHATEDDVQCWMDILYQINKSVTREEAKYTYADAMIEARIG